MENQTIYLMVKVEVQSVYGNISETVNEIETQSKIFIANTPEVKVLETEILLTRVRNLKNINHGTQH